MRPILFDASATTWETNGIGRLDPISCVVREELNGLYELDMEYPASGPLFNDLAVSNIIYAQPYDGAGPQPFRIYKVGKAINGRVTVNARHLSYQLNWLPVMPFNYSSLSDCLEKLSTYSVYENPFSFETNKTVITGGAFVEPLPCRSMLGGVQWSILQRYGGDYEWDGYTVKLWLRRGSDNGVRIAYGKNLIDAKQETNIENTYTGVCPYWKNEDDIVTLPEKYILANTAANFPFLRIQTVDFSSEWQDKPTVQQLRERTETYITANKIGHPNVSVDVNFVALWQTEEYANIAPLERVQLGDTVTVYFEKLDINEQARVVAYEYDVLRERYTNITVGDAKSSFAKTFVDQGRLIEETQTELSAEITKGVSWLTKGNGYVVAVKNTDGSWKEMLFLDTPSIQTAQKVLRINENGIGFSSTGYTGTYAQAWTLDGILSLGGINNAYGQLIINDESNPVKAIIKLDNAGLRLYDAANTAHVIAEFAHSGIELTHYSSNGTKTGDAWLDGQGLSILESGSNAAGIDVAAGQLSVTDTGGETSMLTGSELSVAGVSITNDTVDATTVVADTLQAGDIEVNGETGQNTTITVGGYDLTFNGGVLTDATGSAEPQGYTGNAMLEGDVYVFKNGRLIEVQ